MLLFPNFAIAVFDRCVGFLLPIHTTQKHTYTFSQTSWQQLDAYPQSFPPPFTQNGLFFLEAVLCPPVCFLWASLYLFLVLCPYDRYDTQQGDGNATRSSILEEKHRPYIAKILRVLLFHFSVDFQCSWTRRTGRLGNKSAILLRVTGDFPS